MGGGGNSGIGVIGVVSGVVTVTSADICGFGLICRLNNESCRFDNATL